MLEYVSKLTLEPSCMTDNDVTRLRDVGFDDTQILEIVQLASWFNYMTRVADALGVEVESWRQDWTRELWEDRADQVLVQPTQDKDERDEATGSPVTGDR